MINQLSRASEEALFENAVFLNLLKYGKIQYYQRRSGGEIDFILTDNKIGIEAKQTGSPADLKKLRSLTKTLKLKGSYVITKNFSGLSGFIPAMDI